MDPVTCYDEFLAALREGRPADAGDRADELETWFRRGGDVPPKLQARRLDPRVLGEMFGHASLVLMWAGSDLEGD